MAAPVKRNFDYFNLRNDFFFDTKIEELIMSLGAESVTIYLFLLCDIYNNEGYFIKWDKSVINRIIKNLLIKNQNRIQEVINYCCHVGLFDKELLKNENILTSKGIQTRYISINKQLKRTNFFVKKEYNLIDNISKINGDLKVSSEETNIISEITPINSEITPLNPEVIGQKKRKEKKRKTNKGNGINSEETFFEILNFYQGTKRDFDTEFANFKKLFDDWEDILPNLLPSLKKQTEYRNHCSKNNIFVPNPKHFKNWISQRCWEETTPEIPKEENDGYIQWKGNPPDKKRTPEQQAFYDQIAKEEEEFRILAREIRESTSENTEH